MAAGRSLTILLCLLAAGISCFAVLPTALNKSEFLPGFDAYYYAMQADWLVKTGDLRIPDASPVHYAVAGLMRFFALGAEDALRLWTGLSLFLFYCALLVLAGTSKAARTAALLFVWALVSPTLFFIASELPKTFSLLIVLTLCAAAFAQGRRGLFLLAPLLLLAVWLHKSAVVFAAIFAFAAALQFFRSGVRVPLRGSLFFCGALLLAGGAYFAFSPDPLHVQDLLRLRGENLTPGVLSLASRGGLAPLVKREFIVAGLCFGAVFWAWLRPSGHMPGTELMKRFIPFNEWNRPVAPILCAVLLIASVFIPALGDEAFSFGERFGLLLPYWTIIGIFLLTFEREEFAGFTPDMAAWLLIAALAGAGRFKSAYPHGPTEPYKEYAAVVAFIEKQKPPMLICHRGIHFFYKLRTGRDAFSYEPEPHWDKTRVWRLAYGVSLPEWNAYLPPECGWGSNFVQPIPNRLYTLVREDCFEAARDAVSEDMNPDLYRLLRENNMNPSQPRPAFLYPKHRDNDVGEEFPALPPT